MEKSNKTTGSRTQLRDAILSGQYMAGTYLPSARELARTMGISKSLVHNILKLLQEEGLIQIYPGCGALVMGESERSAGLKRFFLRPSDFGTFGYYPVAGELLHAVAAGAERKNAEILLSFSDSGRLTDEIIAHHMNNTIQGVIYCQCSSYENLIEPLERAAVPCVIAADTSGLEKATRIYLDYREIARCAVRYLAAHGHRKIGIITGSSRDYLYSEMLAGFRGALAEEELPIEKKWQLTGVPFDEPGDPPAVVVEYLNQPDMPTAVFTVRDYRARWVYSAIENSRRRIPDDLSVLSFDGHTWPDGKYRKLTTYSEPLRKQGEIAVELLRNWVTSGKRPDSIKMEPELLERGSVRVL